MAVFRTFCQRDLVTQTNGMACRIPGDPYEKTSIPAYLVRGNGPPGSLCGCRVRKRGELTDVPPPGGKSRDAAFVPNPGKSGNGLLGKKNSYAVSMGVHVNVFQCCRMPPCEDCCCDLRKAESALDGKTGRPVFPRGTVEVVLSKISSLQVVQSHRENDHWAERLFAVFSLSGSSPPHFPLHDVLPGLNGRRKSRENERTDVRDRTKQVETGFLFEKHESEERTAPFSSIGFLSGEDQFLPRSPDGTRPVRGRKDPGCRKRYGSASGRSSAMRRKVFGLHGFVLR